MIEGFLFFIGISQNSMAILDALGFDLTPIGRVGRGPLHGLNGMRVKIHDYGVPFLDLRSFLEKFHGPPFESFSLLLSSLASFLANPFALAITPRKCSA